MSRDADFRAAVDALRVECVEMVEATLYQRALTPEGTTDRIFYLKCNARDRYSDRITREQLDVIRREAYESVIAGLQEEILALPPAERAILLGVLARAGSAAIAEVEVQRAEAK